MSVRVAFVIVSHSSSLASGVAELAAQMAPDVHFEAAGGTEDGRIGTSYDRVEAAVEAALASVEGKGSGVIVLTDLGSATMTVESVIDMSDESERVRFVDTALVEGAVASAVRAQLGEDLSRVAGVAASLAPRVDADDARGVPGPATADVGGTTVGGQASSMGGADRAEADVIVADPVGLHARPAAAFVRLAGSFDAEVTVNGVDGGSVLELMSLGVTQGQSIHIEAIGVNAIEAVAALTDMLEGTGHQPSDPKETS
ncbi:PTS-dependent dihydroxyacetone kinase phosphotransferase subunit DhaM [Schaalia meyeri]|uniref:Phosphocarrier protein HPr n=1 Tax=Schaalia meyeri TaxID=52773 RepID=A0AAQ0BXK4_9ACTO|nr:dihydroxyacetone kinase phosphoryl donor subunit DhaM [Schaalia meyeri]QQC44562.1 PTS-dependent dihydroxyacetone kinase phosphotransferase subunit DhaM [Schaalia meyeri]SDR64587.1 PTS hybrid protein [Schaalia meyeri]